MLDIMGITALGAYSLRRLRSGYNGSCLRVRRGSDSAEQDIGFSGLMLDIAALTAFVGAGDGFITKWYDQSGSARDLAQVTAALQPKIVASGVYLGGIRPDDASSQHLLLSNAAFQLASVAATVSFVTGEVVISGTALGSLWRLGGVTENRIWLGTDPGSLNLVIRKGGANAAPAPALAAAATGNILTLTKTPIANMSGVSLFRNGSSASTFSGSALGAFSGELRIGNLDAAGESPTPAREAIVFGLALADGPRQLLERSQSGAFGIAIS